LNFYNILCIGPQPEKTWKEECKRLVMTAFARSEKRLKPNWRELFTDVYDEMPAHIREQKKQMEEHVQKYAEHYPLKSFSTKPEVA